MTKGLRMLAGGAVLGALMLGFSSVFNAHEASAESPPNPPSRFVGTVLVNGVPPPGGTRIEAKIGASTCGVTTTFASGATQNYKLDSPALDPGASPNCGADGAPVSFWIGDKQAKETGVWHNYQLNTVNLTYVTPTSPTPTPKVVVPGAPVTGSGYASGSDSSLWLMIAIGAGLLALSASGLVAVRRGR